ncbi:MAG TPA: hypothetical protein VNN18_11340 [Candidatus Xenobia bacterium]|nr:hypothetical protein [Candidatus Xenobia bacterium]
MATTFDEGVNVKHGQYGLGTIVASDEDRTTIDFVEHGTKKFVTSMVVLELTDEKVPRREAKPRRTRRKAKSAK